MGVVAGRPLRTMSEGERRKAELLVAMAHHPDLLILDDPILGLDARARREMLWATLEMVREDGTTILFTSHVLQDVERMVDHVVILDRGSVRIAGQLEDLLAKTKRLVFPEAGPDLARLNGEVRRTVHGRDLTVVVRDLDPDAARTLQRQHPRMQLENLNLEEIFCAVISDAPPVPEAQVLP
jgi:ABC-2 type transport system ATP-binding protein